MVILTQVQIQTKIKRMAMEIYERHAEEKQIYLVGINNMGLRLANLLAHQIKELSPLKTEICSLRLNPANPLAQEVHLDHELSALKNKVIILCDDVCNTGRTLFFGCKPFLNIIAKTLEVAVLVERMHKLYPISIFYCGIKLATTTKENILVRLNDATDWSVTLSE